MTSIGILADVMQETGSLPPWTCAKFPDAGVRQFGNSLEVICKTLPVVGACVLQVMRVVFHRLAALKGRLNWQIAAGGHVFRPTPTHS
jgi:hypothetical protein